jgi:putative methyltransferase (TIGR04325 family)
MRNDDVSTASTPTLDPGFKVWDGVYASFAEAPAVGPGFDGSIWRDRSLQAARETIERAQNGEPLDYSLRQRNALLPTLAATILVEQPRVRILDFGGGLGTGFVVLTSMLREAAGRIDYSVVEVDSICRTGREIFAGGGPAFHSIIPAETALDIVHAASVMQYIENWQSVVARLAAYCAPYLSLADIFIGDFKTYATLQSYYGSRIRHWFFNADDFIGEVERNGYSLVLRSHCDAKILGKYGPLPMDNFPPELRLANTSNLLFRRQDVSV